MVQNSNKSDITGEFFQATDSKVFIKNSEIIIRKVVTNTRNNYWIHSLLLLGLLFYLRLINITGKDGKFHSFLGVIFYLYLAFPHLERIFNFIFLDYWSNRISIKRISRIRFKDAPNEFEVIVRIWVGRRRKDIVFRKSEMQSDRFVETISGLHPGFSSAVFTDPSF